MYDQPVAKSEDSQQKRQRIPLIVGVNMTCPRCKKGHNILEYVPMQQIEEFKSETNPIYKCPKCRWIFSPTPQFLHDLV